jgi:hypothetical protein
MMNAREEELQISWACSAQNPDLLPESIQKKNKAAKKAANRARLDAEFKEKFKR